MSRWIIVYPKGDHSRLAVVEICDGMEYEINDYSIASRRRFPDINGESGETMAVKHARKLADEHHLTFQHDGYLD